MLAAIRSGDVDGFIQTPGPTQALADAGELKVLFEVEEALPSPWPSFCVWATDDMIENDEDTVRRFVKATLDTVSYIQNNPDYTTNIYIQRTNASSTVASKVVKGIKWQPSGAINENGLKNLLDVYQKGGDIDPNTAIRIEDTYASKFVTGS